MQEVDVTDRPIGQHAQPELLWFALTILICCVFVVTATLTIDKDHAFGIVTQSRALYSDEGWYLKAARHLNVFDVAGFDYDFQHWPAAPIYNAVQSGVFQIFGVGMETARGWSVVATVGALLAFHAACCRALSAQATFVAVALVASTFLVLHFSRTALADPTATFFSLLAILAYVRLPVSPISIGLSLFLAAIAAMTKSYYLIVFFVILLNLTGCLMIVPRLRRERPNWPLVGFMTAVIAFLAILYAIYYLTWSDSISLWTRVTLGSQTGEVTGSTTFSDAISRAQGLLKRMIRMLRQQANIEVLCAAAAGGVLAFVGHALIKRFPPEVSLRRADWLFLSWAGIGFFAMSLLQVLRSHYLFSLIFPLTYLAVAFWERSLPRRPALALLLLLLIGHVSSQLTSFSAWFARDPDNRLSIAYREIAEIVGTAMPADAVGQPLIGMVSSSIALYDARVIPLEPFWTPQEYTPCDRIARWRPDHYVHLSGHRTSAIGFDTMTACPNVLGMAEVGRWEVHSPWDDALVLYRLELEPE